MPRSRRRKKKYEQPIPRPQAIPPMPPPLHAQISLGYDPKGKMEPQDVVESKEGWSEYKLADGSKIRIKGVLLDAKRAVGQFNNEGDPIYVMQVTMVQQLIVPDELKKDFKR